MVLFLSIYKVILFTNPSITKLANRANYFKIIIASLGTALTWLFSAWDTTLMVLN